MGIEERGRDAVNVVKILQSVVDDMCGKYCKYPDQWDEEAEGMELCESDICLGCPLNKLV